MFYSEPWMFACGDGRCIYNTWKCGESKVIEIATA